MGKRTKKLKGGDQKDVPVALLDQVSNTATNTKAVTKTTKRKRRLTDDEEADEQFISAKLGQRILNEAAKQRQEIITEEFGRRERTKKNKRKPSLTATDYADDAGPNVEDDDETNAYFDDSNDWSDIQPPDTVELDADVEEAFNKFLVSEPTAQRTLFDLIQDKIDEKRTEVASQFSVGGRVQMRELDPRLIDMYRGVRDVLSSYRSGKLPKAFKIIPKFVNWEQILSITEPDKWTAAAMYQATRIFVSNLNASLCQRFLNLVLLPRVRDDIAEYKRLNFHLYQALHKALFKPGAFFKGILLPLCESGSCTLREATIFSSVLTKSSIPMLHAAAAMLKIAEMNYSGANSMFLRVLLDKKYTLPYRVIDGLVAHFVRFTHDQRELPVLWHQSLLVFVQRYKADISSEQKEALFDLVKNQNHYMITPEVRRELQHTKPRDTEDLSNVMEV